MSNVYTTRTSFTIARNDDLNITLFGMWYRHDATEYVVATFDKPSQRFAKLSNALECFERLTAAPITTVTTIDATPEEDEAWQAMSTSPASSFACVEPNPNNHPVARFQANAWRNP